MEGVGLGGVGDRPSEEWVGLVDAYGVYSEVNGGLMGWAETR